MFVKLLTVYGSAKQNGNRGDVIEVSDEEGRKLIDGEYAIAATDKESAPLVERARKAAEEAARNVEVYVIKQIAGPDFQVNAGQIIKVTDEQARKFIAAEAMRIPTIDDRRRVALRDFKSLSPEEITRELWELKHRLSKLETQVNDPPRRVASVS